MVHKSDLVALRRKTKMADPALALVESVTNRILNLITVLGMVDYSQLTVCAPVRPRNIFENLSRRTSGKGCAGAHTSFRFQVLHVSAVECHRQFTGAGD